MTERERITRVRLGKTQAGQTVADLFSHDTRLQHPFLRVFDLSMLLNVNIKPDDLTPEPIHTNFWGLYVLSDKLTAKGNPYKDVISLEPIDAPATTTSVDTSALLGELRAIKALLFQLVTQEASLGDESDTNDADQTRAARLAKLSQVRTHGTINGPLDTHATDPAHALEHLKPPATSEAEAREEFYRLSGPAITSGQVTANEINDLVRAANGGGWPAALAELKEKLSCPQE